jgi:hypothetical protein
MQSLRSASSDIASQRGSTAAEKPPLSPILSRPIDSGFYGRDDDDDDDDDETLHLPDTLDELIGPISEIGDTEELNYADTDSVSALDEAIEAMLAKRRALLAQTRQKALSSETTKGQELDREIEAYFRERRGEQKKQGLLAQEMPSVTMSYVQEKEREQRWYAEETKREQQQRYEHEKRIDNGDRRRGFIGEKSPETAAVGLRVFPVVKKEEGWI